MEDGAGLRLTTARYYTPNGTSIQAKGITPDVLVPLVAVKTDAVSKDHSNFLREKDLRHHLENGGNLQPADEKPEPPAMDESKSMPDKVTTDAKTKEQLKNDNQLNTALLVLKSLDVLSWQKNVK
jgi:carboxyl-terminal processing protease